MKTTGIILIIIALYAIVWVLEDIRHEIRRFRKTK